MDQAYRNQPMLFGEESPSYSVAPVGLSSRGVSAERLTRADDPATSREAAERLVDSGAIHGDSADALALVRDNPGRTAYELEAIDKMPSGKGFAIHSDRPDRIRKRLSGLEKAGLVRKGQSRQCMERGSNCSTWWPV